MKILLIAYAIEPGKGSEEGVGYHFCKGIAQHFDDVTLITRSNNIPALQQDPALTHVSFIGVDVPRCLGFFKKRSRGILLYYFLWQWTVGRYVRKLPAFDIIHQVTFAAAWAPHFLNGGRARIFWGPLLNNPSVPRDFWFSSPVLFCLKEMPRRMLRFYFFHVDPFLRRTIRRSHVIFMAAPVIPAAYRHALPKIVLMPNAASSFPVLTQKDNPSDFTILYVGRFLDIKGCVPALDAYRLFYNRLSAEDKKRVTMRIIGQGILEKQLRAAKADNVTILPWQNQENLKAEYQKAAVFLFPSLESQGMVVAEALSQGCPVICLEKTGPAMLAGEASCPIEQGTYAAVVESLAEKLYAVYTEYRDRPDRFQTRIETALVRAAEFSWDKKIDRVVEIYRENRR